ncbi:hypothetical protein FOZ63_014451, partial [Perkinsus olseni]
LLRGKMTALATTVRKLGLPSFRSVITDELLRDRPDGKKALADLKGVCGTVKWGMIEEFGSFYGACDTYADSAEAAVNTAVSKGWRFHRYGGIRHITRPDPNMKEGGEKESAEKKSPIRYNLNAHVRAVRLGGNGILTGAARVLSLIARASVESSLCHLSTSAWVQNDLYFSVVGGCLA